MHNSGITLGVFVSWHAFEHTRTQNPGVRNLCVTHAGVLGVFLVTGVSVFRTFSLIPLLRRPSQDNLHDFRYQEETYCAAEVLAHRFHVSVLKFYGSNTHKTNYVWIDSQILKPDMQIPSVFPKRHLLAKRAQSMWRRMVKGALH